MPIQLQQHLSIGYGLGALLAELENQGITQTQWLRHAQINSITGYLTQTQRFQLLCSARELGKDPLMALKAGQRQRAAHFGIFGFALVTSDTFLDAFKFGWNHLEFAGKVHNTAFELKNTIGIFSATNHETFGVMLPFIAEFWRSSMTALCHDILQEPFPSLYMSFPYPRPEHADFYRQVFNCPVEFETDTMEWHFDTQVFDKPCPSANAVTANLCKTFCIELLQTDLAQSVLQRELRAIILTTLGKRWGAEQLAEAVGLSKRTLFRKLAAEGTRLQDLMDETRQTLACEYLSTTALPVTEIAERCGFKDEANFRKAFTKWLGSTPSEWRKSNSI